MNSNENRPTDVGWDISSVSEGNEILSVLFPIQENPLELSENQINEKTKGGEYL